MSTRARILLIDDNADFRETLTVRLQADGYQIRAVATGEDGIAAIANEPYDLVLLDMLMPHKDGIATYEDLRANPRTRRLPIIMLTGVAVEGHWEPMPQETDNRAFVMGKPYDLALLVARIDQVLAQAKGAT